MTLHQINQLAYPGDTESLWQQSLGHGDAIIFIEEACLRLQQMDTNWLQKLTAQSIHLYYLHKDALAYGIQPKWGKALSDTEWVELTFSANKHVSW
ncbi:DsrH/TusB family sulfur metabolism protein [Marinomonas sp. THO17]|uniref:DsrH/TusB family sulfur metabolism protein n=1 Tax=Marinomonas sp. THO17 TaxID=3149048 RepID=UPI00336BE25B